MKPSVLKYKGKKYYAYESPCPTWLKNKYREAVNYICQDCKEHENKVGTLEPHRILRGVEGGLYTVLQLNHPRNNIKVCCKDCHKKYNYSRRINY